MFGKWMFYISVVVGLILIIENMVTPGGAIVYFLLFRTSVGLVVAGSLMVGFFMGFGLKTFLMSQNNEFDNDDY